MLLRSLLGLIAVTALAAQGQEPAFEVASVKPAQPPAGARTMASVFPMAGSVLVGGRSRSPGRIDYPSVDLRTLLMRAYGLRPYEISGPSWLETEFYNVVAKVPPATTQEQLGPMLQRLLTERFRIESHRESRPMKAYTLTVAKSGHKLTPAQPATAPADAEVADEDKLRSAMEQVFKAGAARLRERELDGSSGPGFHIHIGPAGATVGEFARQLSASLNEPVIDRTGIEGKYEFDLDCSSDSGPVVYTGAPIFLIAGPSLFSAVEKQLGLKLEAGKGPVEMLVIDKAEKTPTEN